MAKFHEVTLETVCEGSSKELFQRGLNDILANIQDVNTDPEAKRRVSLVFTFRPTEDRSSAVVTVDLDIKTAPVCSIGGTVFITKEDGVRKAYANATKQEPLFPQEKESGEPIKVVNS